MALTLNPAWLEAVMLAVVRMVTFLVIAPPFSHRAVPARVKMAIALGLGLAVSPRVAEGYVPQSTAGFVTALAQELLVGAVLGFLVLLVYSAISAAGTLIDLFGGFSMAQVYDPQSMVNGAQFARLYAMAATVLMFTSDAYQLIITGLTRSFDALPLGGGVDLAGPAQTITEGVGQMFLASLQIAGPLLAVLFLADVGLGLLTRVAPALNAFAMGFPLKIFLTVTLAGVMFVALPRVVAALTDDAVDHLMGVS
ncbi:flagellar biosynthetic protein FliR [Georgenia sp. AZ-5]|uniref:flagellar biosynthetic protein FliR n=1 Tax=Georgenia sp. AZ-5 TaxID=3367526 RepID=UPI003754E435